MAITASVPTHIHQIGSARTQSACLFGLFLINVLLFWPGQMSPDSYAQYESALTGIYGDHHPPMMSVVWRYLAMLVPGSGLMFLLHLLMLYSAAAFFMSAARSSCARWLAMLLPAIPPLCFYSSMIWKDVGFAFAYLLGAALISYCVVHLKKPNGLLLASVSALLLYGTAVKFQALYVLPLPLVGLSYCFTSFQLSYKTVVYAALSYLLCLYGVQTFNNMYVPADRKSHSWQLVKLYDLAGISVLKNKPLFPDYLSRYNLYSFEKVKEKFNHERVDDLVGFTDSPLRIGVNENERSELLSIWWSAVLQHPHYYLWHRLCNWWRMVNIIPIERLNRLDFSKYAGLRWFCTVQWLAQQPLHSPEINWIAILLSKIFFALFELMRYALRISSLLPCILFYLYLGIKKFYINRAAAPLILLNSIAVAMLITLFFFSMASAIRYMYIVICMVHASHGFAYECMREDSSLGT